MTAVFLACFALVGVAMVVWVIAAVLEAATRSLNASATNLAARPRVRPTVPPKRKPSELERWTQATSWTSSDGATFQAQRGIAAPKHVAPPERAVGEGDVSYARRLQDRGYTPRQFGVTLGPATIKARKRQRTISRWGR